jgi:hypothetical protein
LLPVLGIALEVHDGQDKDSVGPDLVENAVGKSADNAASRARGNEGPCLREGTDPIKGKLHLLGELVPETWSFLVVVVDRFEELSLCT